MANNNSSLLRVQKNKNDEYYTPYDSIAEELMHYSGQFAGKRVFCNCDDYKYSNFVTFFKDNFIRFGLVGLVAIGYVEGGRGTKYEYDGKTEKITMLSGSGDFAQQESVNELNRCDIVATNPPFSLDIKFFRLLVESGKKFICIANSNHAATAGLFDYFKDGKIKFGYTKPKKFVDILGEEKSFGYTRWFTNFKVDRVNPELNLTCRYDPVKYPMFDNCNAISVDRLNEIPFDYPGLMGVPATILEVYNPSQIEIVCKERDILFWDTRCQVDDVPKFTRLIIKLTDKWLSEHDELL